MKTYSKYTPSEFILMPRFADVLAKRECHLAKMKHSLHFCDHNSETNAIHAHIMMEFCDKILDTYNSLFTINEN